MTGALLSAALAALMWPERRHGWARRVAPAGARGRWNPLPLPLPGAGGRWCSLPSGPSERQLVWSAAAGTTGLAAVASTPLVALLAGVLAFVGARAWAADRRHREEDDRLAELSEGLGALAAELRSGRPLTAATSTAVAVSGDTSSGRALARALRVTQAGIRPGPGVREDAARVDAARVDAVRVDAARVDAARVDAAREDVAGQDAAREDAAAGGDRAVRSALDRISAAVELSARTGCSLADVIGAVDEDLRVRRRHRLELRAAVAAPRASALLLAGLPVLGFAMGSGIGADPWQVLTTTGAGQVLLVAGVAFELAGLVWSRRLVAGVLR